MNKITFPDWSLKYKTRGTSLRYSNGRIQLYKVSSHRVKGVSYPVTISEYIGTITEEGIIYKKVKIENISFIEYGLSFFIYNHFYRDLTRLAYGYKSIKKEAIIIYSIVKYVFKYVDEYIINNWLLAIKYKDILLPLLNNENKTINLLVNKIPMLFNREFKNDSLRIQAYLRTLYCDSKTRYESIKLEDILTLIRDVKDEK